MHIASGYPFYCYEARQRMYSYPPPYNGGYATPWLWYDGDETGSYSYSAWQTKIVNRMNQVSPIAETMWGTYSSFDGNGTISVQFRNDSTAAINGRVIIVVTEDSLYFSGPNGDVWHNHVARDYLPTHNGQIVNILVGDSITVTENFSIQSTWDENKCMILAWIQDDNYVNQRKEVWQGGMIAVNALVGVEEYIPEEMTRHSLVVSPNPCVNGAEFAFDLAPGEHYEIQIYDVTGQNIRRLDGIAGNGEENVYWNRHDNQGSEVSSGVYLYRFRSESFWSSGKIVVR
jgi:hypothetical protein